jgi:hypothetical protein
VTLNRRAVIVSQSWVERSGTHGSQKKHIELRGSGRIIRFAELKVKSKYKMPSA